MNFSMFLERGLNKLIEEISLYEDETDIWKIKGGISNSAGNLVLHLVGNLNHFIGKSLGNMDYVRMREKEFSLKDIPRQKLIVDINNTREIIKTTLSKLTEEDLKKQFPLNLNDEIFSVENMLLHLSTHLNYHLGQVNYHRRLISF